jgi:hypothetical protein
MDDSKVMELALKICHTESRPAVEIIEAVPVGPGRFRLLYSPGMVEGAARDDLIELSDTDPKGFTVVQRSGYLAVWFYFQEQGRNKGPDGDQVRAAVEEFGGLLDGGGNTNLVFAVPVSLGFPAIEDLFNSLLPLYPGSSWLFANVYDPWNQFKPIGWWD